VSAKQYFSDVFGALRSLWTGMKLTLKYFVHPKEIITEQYPNNRETLKMADRFRGEVVMPHDANNEHACTGCTSCEIACPNGTIQIATQQILQPDGRKKKAVDKFIYHLEMCTMCGLCIEACPTDAIKMVPTFEHSVYDRKLLTKQLNLPESKVRDDVKG
jgi:NADH-quinone oxidoreductase subunit I